MAGLLTKYNMGKEGEAERRQEDKEKVMSSCSRHGGGVVQK